MTNIKSSQINLLKWFFGLLSFGMVVLVVITCLQSDMFNLHRDVFLCFSAAFSMAARRFVW